MEHRVNQNHKKQTAAGSSRSSKTQNKNRERPNLRGIVLTMLIRTLEQGELSHLVLNETFQCCSFSASEKAFINRLYSGTMEKLVFEDYLLDQISDVPVRKMKPVIRNILRMGIYQILFMDSVPDHAGINEAVKLTRKKGFSNLTGFVNALLRKITVLPEDYKVPDYVKACVPEWIFSLLTEQYGQQQTEEICRAFQKTSPETFICRNQKKADGVQLTDALQEEGVQVRQLEDPDLCYAISGFDSLTGLRAFRDGMFFIQNPSAVQAVLCACEGTENPEFIIDVCAAPGGKSMVLAQLFPSARILSRDLTEGKISRIRENTARLGLVNIEPQVFDACKEDPACRNAADLVIADLPCSGLGVVSRKPDILNRLKPEDLTALQALQREMLGTVQEYVKPGGVLLFSTCTINKMENEENCRWFSEHYGFIPETENRILPSEDGSDGFYYVRFRNSKKAESEHEREN